MGGCIAQPGPCRMARGPAPVSSPSCLDRYAAEGIREVVVDPIGFVCDHVEVLFDIDILFRDYAAGRGIALSRPESLNGSPTFTRALADVARRCLG